MSNPMLTATEAAKRAVDARSNASFQIDKEVDRILEKIRDAANARSVFRSCR